MVKNPFGAADERGAQLFHNPSARRIVGRQHHLDPVARNQPDEIPLHRARQMGQHPPLSIQHHGIDGRGHFLRHRALDRHGLVSTNGPPSVTAMQCSK